jgi:hypothetical protein
VSLYPSLYPSDFKNNDELDNSTTPFDADKTNRIQKNKSFIQG